MERAKCLETRVAQSLRGGRPHRVRSDGGHRSTSVLFRLQIHEGRLQIHEGQP